MDEYLGGQFAPEYGIEDYILYRNRMNNAITTNQQRMAQWASPVKHQNKAAKNNWVYQQGVNSGERFPNAEPEGVGRYVSQEGRYLRDPYSPGAKDPYFRQMTSPPRGGALAGPIGRLPALVGGIAGAAPEFVNRGVDYLTQQGYLTQGEHPNRYFSPAGNVMLNAPYEYYRNWLTGK